MATINVTEAFKSLENKVGNMHASVARIEGQLATARLWLKAHQMVMFLLLGAVAGFALRSVL